jgi:uncharacterized membrane protein
MTPFAASFPPLADKLVDGRAAQADPAGMATLTERIERMEIELRYLERELAEVRRLAAAETTEPAPLRVSSPPVEATPPRPAREEPDWSALLGARALAWAGGGVTVLGIVFFFVLAIERGWIGHDARLALGAITSALVFGAGVWLRERFGDSYAALSAVGAGLAGGFATVVAASSLYHLLPDAAALAVVGVIASMALLLAEVWRSETVAGFGLVAAMLVSMAISWHNGVTQLGVGFVGLALAAAAAVAVLRSWNWLALASLVAAGIQAVALVAEHHKLGVPFALAFAAIALATSVGLTLHRELDYEAASLALLSAVLGGGSLALAYGGRTEGWTLVALFGAYLAVAAVVFRFARDLAATLVAIALALGAIAAADLVSLFSLTAVWSVEAVLLAWLATRVDRRFSYSSLAFLTLAIGHALATEAKPRDLFVASHDPARGLPALLLCIAAAAVAAWLLEETRDAVAAVAAVAATLVLYALSLSLLELFEYTGTDVHTLFQRGHTAVSAMWGIVGAATLYAGLRLAKRRLQIGGFALFGLALAKLFLYDLAFLSSVARAFSFLAVGAMLLAAGFAYQRLAGPRSP